MTKNFQACIEVAESIGEELIKPSTDSRPMYRLTAGTCNSKPEEYYRVIYCYLTLDSIIADIEHRLGKRQQQIIKIGWLIPSILCSLSLSIEEQWEQLYSTLNLYTVLFPDPRAIIKSEFKLSRNK